MWRKELQKHKYTDGASDIGDYVNSILDESSKKMDSLGTTCQSPRFDPYL